MSCNIRVAVLVLGYFILVLLDLPNAGLLINSIIIVITVFGYIPWQMMVIFRAMLSYLFFDITFCILMLVGAHKKNPSILRVYFWYGIAGVIWKMVLFTAKCVILFISNPDENDLILRDPKFYVVIFWFGLVDVAIKISLLVLVRKEMRRLQNNS